MNLKKILMLSSMALAAIAFAAPAASAELPTWTHDHEFIEGSEKVEQSFEGHLSFHRPPFGTFGCDVTATVVAKAGTTATVTKFEPTTETCTGVGAFAGCVLTHDTANVPWDAHVNGTKDNETNSAPLSVTKDDDDVTITNVYHGCAVPQITHTHLEFEQVEVTAEMNDETTIVGLESDDGQLDTTELVEPTGTLNLHDPETPTLGLLEHG
jgi:hypothetical protein